MDFTVGELGYGGYVDINRKWIIQRVIWFLSELLDSCIIDEIRCRRLYNGSLGIMQSGDSSSMKNEDDIEWRGMFGCMHS